MTRFGSFVFYPAARRLTGSKNGTRVDGRLVTERLNLRDGDRIRLGSVDAVFRDTPSVQPTETQLDVAD